MRTLSWRSRLVQAVLGMVSLPICPGCGQEAGSDGLALLCARCRPRDTAQPLCRTCGRWLPDSPSLTMYPPRWCRRCRPLHPSFDWARSQGRYQGGWREGIVEFKRRPGGELLAQLARCLTASIRSGTLPGGGDLLVPVPARAGDGRHAAQLLARRIGRETGLPYGNILHFVRRTHTQRGLTRAQRLANLHRAIAVRPRSALLPSRVLVIDDVMTTGATVNECSRALKEAGVRQVGVLTLAQGDIGTMHEKQHGNDMV